MVEIVLIVKSIDLILLFEHLFLLLFDEFI